MTRALFFSVALAACGAAQGAGIGVRAGTTGIGGTFDATVEAGHRAAPYLDIGWGNVSGAGVNFYADLGVMFMGSPKASINGSCPASLSAADCATLQGQAAQQQAELEDKLKHFKTYPVLNIGLTIGF